MFPAFKLKIILNSGTKISSLLSFKDKIPLHIRSLVMYKYTCGSCNAAYIGKTKRHFKVRICEHLGISYRTGKPLKYDVRKPTAVRENIRCDKHAADFTNFKVLGCAKNDYTLQIKESLLIGKEKCDLNKQVKCLKLELF